jgi:hypothetical protein
MSCLIGVKDMKNSIPRFALTSILLFIFILNAFAQTGIGVEPIDKVVETINSKNYETPKPYLLKETKVGNLAPQFTEAVLSQLLSQIGKVESVRLLKKVSEGAATRYFCSFKFSDKEREYDFLLNPDNKFLELNIVKAEVKKVTKQFNGEDASFPQKIEVPLLLAKKHILVQAEINGRKGNFVFDSGAPALILNQSRFKLPEGETTLGSSIKGVSGSFNNLSYFKAQSFNWSGIGFKDKDVATICLIKNTKTNFRLP